MAYSGVTEFNFQSLLLHVNNYSIITWIQENLYMRKLRKWVQCLDTSMKCIIYVYYLHYRHYFPLLQPWNLSVLLQTNSS